MSCNSNNSTHRVTVHGDMDVDDRRGRHEWDRVGLKDLIHANREGEGHRDLLREILESKFEGVKTTLESKADVLRAIAESRADSERTARENLRDLILIRRCGNRCGGGDHD